MTDHRLKADGGAWLREDGGYWLLEGTPAAITNATPSTATGTGSALAPTVKVSTPAGLCSGTGSALSPTVMVTFYAELASGVGTAFDATTTSADPVVYTFTCPSWDQIPPTVDEAPALSNRLMRFFRARPMGRNIWILPNDTCTFDQPWPTVEDTGANRDSLFPVEDPQLGKSWSNLQTVTYKRVYWGGHTYRLDTSIGTQAEEVLRLADFLTTAGYDPNDWLVLQ